MLSNFFCFWESWAFCLCLELLPSILHPPLALDQSVLLGFTWPRFILIKTHRSGILPAAAYLQAESFQCSKRPIFMCCWCRQPETLPLVKSFSLATGMQSLILSPPCSVDVRTLSLHVKVNCMGMMGPWHQCIQHATVSQCAAVAVMKREAQATAKSLQTLHDWAEAWAWVWAGNQRFQEILNN